MQGERCLNESKGFIVFVSFWEIPRMHHFQGQNDGEPRQGESYQGFGASEKFFKDKYFFVHIVHYNNLSKAM